jgi:hypothetical protein
VSFCMYVMGGCVRTCVMHAYELINTPSYRTKMVLICVVQLELACGAQKGNLNGCVCGLLANGVW